MSEYENFSKDFIDRTLTILYTYSGEDDVTSLINNCLGLIIIPKQLLDKNIPEYMFTKDDHSYGINKENIKYEGKGDFSLKNILRHIRNGLAHGRIDQKTENKVIVGIRIHDIFKEKEKENFAIVFTVEELKTFAVKIAEGFLNTDKTSSHLP